MYTVTTYQELTTWARAFAENADIHALFIVGPPGTMKTSIFEEFAGGACRWLTNRVSAFEFYRQLWDFRDQPFILDDVDAAHRDGDLVGLLKAVCQSCEVKFVGWHTAAPQLDKAGIDREFKTRSRVCLISNDWERVNTNVGALEDRGFVVHFAPTAAELHSRIKKIDPEVMEFMSRNLPLIARPSARYYGRAAALKGMKLDWRAWLRAEWQPDPRLVALVDLLPLVQSRGELEKRWTERTGCSRSSYYRFTQGLPTELAGRVDAVPKAAKVKAAG